LNEAHALITVAVALRKLVATSSGSSSMLCTRSAIFLIRDPTCWMSSAKLCARFLTESTSASASPSEKCDALPRMPLFELRSFDSNTSAVIFAISVSIFLCCASCASFFVEMTRARDSPRPLHFHVIVHSMSSFVRNFGSYSSMRPSRTIGGKSSCVHVMRRREPE